MELVCTYYEHTKCHFGPLWHWLSRNCNSEGYRALDCSENLKKGKERKKKGEKEEKERKRGKEILNSSDSTIEH